GSPHAGQGAGYGPSDGAPLVYGRTGMATGWSGETYSSGLDPDAEEALLTVGLLRQMLAGGGDPYEGLRHTLVEGNGDPRRQGQHFVAGGYHGKNAPGQRVLPGGYGHYSPEAAKALEDIAQLEQL